MIYHHSVVLASPSPAIRQLPSFQPFLNMSPIAADPESLSAPTDHLKLKRPTSDDFLPSPGAPSLPPWIAPAVTKKDREWSIEVMSTQNELTSTAVEWASLETIDLTLLDSESPSVRAELIATAKRALSVDGFLYGK